MAASGLDGGEERERVSAVVPPGGTVAEESAKLVWACKRFFNGNKRPVRSIQLLKSVFIKFRRSPSSMAIRQRTRLAVANQPIKREMGMVTNVHQNRSS
jgi:hypothetical protein